MITLWSSRLLDNAGAQSALSFSQREVWEVRPCRRSKRLPQYPSAKRVGTFVRQGSDSRSCSLITNHLSPTVLKSEIRNPQPRRRNSRRNPKSGYESPHGRNSRNFFDGIDSDVRKQALLVASVGQVEDSAAKTQCADSRSKSFISSAGSPASVVAFLGDAWQYLARPKCDLLFTHHA